MNINYLKFDDYLSIIDNKANEESGFTPVNFLNELKKAVEIVKLEILENLILIPFQNKNYYLQRLLRDLTVRFDDSITDDVINGYLKQYNLAVENIDNTFVHWDNYLVKFLNSKTTENKLKVRIEIFDLDDESRANLTDDEIFENIEYYNFSHIQDSFIKNWANESIKDLKDFVLMQFDDVKFNSNLVNENGLNQSNDFDNNNAHLTKNQKIILLKYLEELNRFKFTQMDKNKTTQAKILSLLLGYSENTIRTSLSSLNKNKISQKDSNRLLEVLRDYELNIPELNALIKKRF